MNPPAEQLVRDFLNRLSLAARGKLGFAERQSLLDRTRARIEAECGAVDHATAVQVRKVLVSLGDPVAIVEQAQINGAGGESVANVDVTEPAAHQASSGSQAVGVPVNRGGLPTSARLVAKGEKNKPVVETDQLAEAALFAAPEQPAESEPDNEPAPVPPQAPSKPEPSKPGPSKPGPSKPGPAKLAPSKRALDPQRLTGATAAGTGLITRWMTGASKMARQNPMELVAVLLLGVGGALYPPIWLVGAVVTLLSRKWAVRDKFLGVGLPVVLVIFGTVMVLVFGGQHSSILGANSYGHEAWLGAERISRITALAGAGYLLWALRRTRRKPPTQPPWRLSPRFG